MLRALQAVAAAVVLRRLARGRRRRPPLQPAATDRSVTVVIPAREEAARIGPCLEALRGEDVIVVDDDSADGTADVARAYGARVIQRGPAPPGWVGKPWALQRGLEEATGEVVVCLDADTRPRPGLLGALAQELDRHDFVSAGPRFVCERPLERWLHASLLASLVYRFGPLDVDAPGRVMSNGQCTATLREWFLAAGGYGLATGYSTDDVALARALPGRFAFRDAADLLEVKMHDSAREVWREWGRSIALADVEPWWRRAFDVAVLALAMVPLLPVRFALLFALRRSYTRGGLPFWLSPLADPLAIVRLIAPPSREWRGERLTK